MATADVAVNWSRFTFKVGIQVAGEKDDGVLRLSRMELAILRRMLSKEVGGEVIAQASENFRKLTMILTAMEQWMVDREAK